MKFGATAAPAAVLNRTVCADRTPHVTMGAVTRPARPPEQSSPDADLLRRIAAGDAAAVDARRGSFSSWLMAMVHHKAVDAVRREESQRRRQSLAGDDLVLQAPLSTYDVEDEAETRRVAQRVRTALGDLPASQREALTLAYYGGYTQREVAALTGAPLGTVKTRMLAGMRRLKEGLGGAAGQAHGLDGPAR